MSEITLEFDKKANDDINDLMKYYNTKSRADIISKAIWTLKLASVVDSTNGQLIARKNGKETVIKLS